MNRRAGVITAIAARARRGLAVQETILLLGAAVVLGTASALIVPTAIRAATGPAAPIVDPPANPELVPVFDAIHALFQQSEGIVASWDRRGGRAQEILLWHHDGLGAGVVNEDEVLLLSFSPTLGALTAYMVGEAYAGTGPAVGRVDTTFPDVFRDVEGVERRVVATGLSRVRFDRTDAEDGEETWTIRLTWGGRTSDESKYEAVFAVRRPVLGVR
ncbi:MAG: hypothetical protein AAFX05_08025 [Planctomycetota bacterium]